MAWRDIFRRRKASDKTDAASRFFLDLLGGNKTAAGVSVTPDTALKQATAWACMRVRSEDMGKLPCLLYQRDGTARRRAVEHHLYQLIATSPNPRQTPFEFKSMMQLQLDMHGNALAIKTFDGRGQIVAVWPAMWKNVTVLQSLDGLDLFYQVRLRNGTTVTLPAEGVVHLRGMSQDGVLGMSPIAYHRETIGLAVAAEQYGAAFFGNNAQPSGVLKVKQVLSKEAVGALREDWEKRFRGSDNAHKLAVLDGEMDWDQIGMDNSDAQFIETRGLSGRDICRIYRVPPHKVADLEQATFSNIEQQAIEYVTDCLMSEMVRWEQALNRDLLTAEERKTYYFKYMPDALLRGDLKSRYEAYAIGRTWGWLCVDKVLELEDMDPLPDNKGQIYLQPLNMIEAGTTPPSSGGAKALLALAMHLVAEEAASDAQS